MTAILTGRVSLVYVPASVSLEEESEPKKKASLPVQWDWP